MIILSHIQRLFLRRHEKLRLQYLVCAASEHSDYTDAEKYDGCDCCKQNTERSGCIAGIVQLPMLRATENLILNYILYYLLYYTRYVFISIPNFYNFPPDFMQLLNVVYI